MKLQSVPSRMLYNDSVMSEDIVQDVFIKIWNKRESLLKVEKFNCWLFILVRNHMLDVFTRQKLQESVLATSSHSSRVIACPHELHFYKEVKSLIHQPAQKLPAQQRLVYLLYRGQGLKKDKVATTLKISPHTVRNHDQKAMRFLREFIAARII